VFSQAINICDYVCANGVEFLAEQVYGVQVAALYSHPETQSNITYRLCTIAQLLDHL
jgi:hypothetical protein